MKQGIEKGRVRLDRVWRERMLQNQWQRIYKNREEIVREREKGTDHVVVTGHSQVSEKVNIFDQIDINGAMYQVPSGGII